jgi:hypothetical protein
MAADRGTDGTGAGRGEHRSCATVSPIRLPFPATARFRVLLEEAHRLVQRRTEPAASGCREDRRGDAGNRCLGVDCQAVPIVHNPQRMPLPMKTLRVPVQVAHDPGLPHAVQPTADPSGSGIDPPSRHRRRSLCGSGVAAAAPACPAVRAFALGRRPGGGAARVRRSCWMVQCWGSIW